MSLPVLVPSLIGGAALWIYSAVALDWKKRAAMPVEDVAQKNKLVADTPFYAPIGHAKDSFFRDTRGMFNSVREDVDVNGARIFFVDYGNGQEVVEYRDPRILL